MVQYEIRITGRVQGVGYRQYVLEKARQLGVTGWVKNTINGDVQVVVKGKKTDVDTLIDFLRIGTSMSRVDNVSIFRMQDLSEFPQFEIL